MRIHRERSKWQDRARAYQVLIDGQPVGEITNGATGEFAVAEGPHTLRLKIDWSGSPTAHLTAAPGQVVEFRCRAAVNPLLGLWHLIRSFRRRDAWIQLEQVPSR